MRDAGRRPKVAGHGLAAGTLAAAAALALASCGGSSGDGATASAASATSATPATAAVKAVKKSPDSDAPATAPAHWLPPAAWVYNHWLPYDEGRLYSVLGITRQELWAQLRDDHRTLAGLAAKHGYPDPEKLAAKLVAPRAAKLGPARAAEMRRRAVATITQGHLAQHLFFHSLHQFAIPSAAPDIFGVTDASFRELRRSELSPLQIGRLQGRSPSSIEGEAIGVLRERMRAGIADGSMTKAQGALLLHRQLTQLPRWLDQARYNGPPLTHDGNLVAKPEDYASNPSISSDGRYVAYEAYRQKLPLAVKLGEIAVLRADVRTGRTKLISAIPGQGVSGPNPVSTYNPAISGDGGQVTYESSTGNQNFAKRYGRIGTLLTNAHDGLTVAVGRPDRTSPDSQSSYNPDVSADGSRVIYQAVRGGRTVVLAKSLRTGRQLTVAAGAVAGGRRYADPYEATITADGSRVAFTFAEGTVADPGDARSSVRVRDLRSGKVVIASRANGAGGKVAKGFSADAAISPDGRFVAFTSTAPDLGVGAGQVGLFLRDLERGTTRRIRAGGARPLDPVIARGARTVAFTAVKGSTAAVMAWSAASGRASVISNGPSGKPGDGFSGDPTISADGRRVAFASTATNLGARKGDGARAIYTRDLRTRRTRKVSDPEVAYAGFTLPPAKPAPVPAAGPVTLTAKVPVDGPDTVNVTDNAFVDGVQRPTLHVKLGTQVTWRWRSHQSHSVLLANGPEQVVSKIRQQGSFKHRFEAAGTYDFVCSLHAPGMKMTVVVDDA